MRQIKVKPGSNKFKLVVHGKKGPKIGELMIYYSREERGCHITITGTGPAVSELSISDGSLRK